MTVGYKEDGWSWKNRKEPWKGKKYTVCFPCRAGFFYWLSLPKIGYYEKMRDGKYRPIRMRMCDSCLNYAVKAKMIVDYKIV